MFTGIVQGTGIIRHIQQNESNKDFWIHADKEFLDQLKIDQSVAHNGVCLTVVSKDEDAYHVTAIGETLQKTTLSSWQINDTVNLELALRIGDRLDGHFVQGHVDTTATLTEIISQEGSWLYRFRFPPQFAALLIEKGSICIDGISLTCFDVSLETFTVAIIPFTHEHTNIRELEEGDSVNLEFDVIGKYLMRKMEVN